MTTRPDGPGPVGRLTAAEDHLQETFLRAGSWLQEHSADLATRRPWLLTVARRIVLDPARSRQLRPTEDIVEDVTQLAVTDNDIDRFVQAHVIRNALRTLSPDHRATLIELYCYDRTAREAADVLGVLEGTVKSRARYAARRYVPPPSPPNAASPARTLPAVTRQHHPVRSAGRRRPPGPVRRARRAPMRLAGPHTTNH